MSEQLDTLGLSRAHVAVLTGLDIREYVVEWNPAEADILRAEARPPNYDPTAAPPR
ncbi:hypothetical protein [Actinokineospora sp.]|uniref:hypothetical protein n=1 Tax=Actinokineospora sp. TaxID=1872133 RepID=UPI004037FBAC